MKPFLAAITVACVLVVPQTAAAGLATVTFRAVPATGERSPAAAAPVGRFDLVGMRWHGRGSVAFSVRSTAGRWGPWLDAAPEEEDQPDADSPEARAGRGWRLGNPTWVGPSNGIRYRLAGDVRDLRAAFVRSPELRIPLRATASVGTPAIVPRSTWGADESIVKGTPSYAPALRFASVHHTAGPNTYTQAQAAAILRGIEVYHVKSNGWNDIGYNFLVDRYGTVYEGRAGGIDRNVVGAHIRGFNTGAVGVAVIGTFQTTPIPAVAENALERLLAWRLDLAHVDPLSTLTVVSGGSERYTSGAPVTLRAVSGHRDTGLTTCPGDFLYARLPAIAAAAQKIGLPKLYEPKVTGGMGGLVRFQARVSGAVPWSVTVADAAGAVVATGTGRGPVVDWAWDSTGSALTGARWRVEVAGATPVTGTVGKASGAGAVGGPLAITALSATPPTISPNGDGQADTTTIAFTTSQPAIVTITLLDGNGVQLADLAPPARLAAGEHGIVFDGLGAPDGVYTVVVTAIATGGASVSAQLQIAISRTLGTVSLAPALLTPNGDGTGDVLEVRFGLAAPASVRLLVQREGKWVATPWSGPLPPGPQTLSWDGRKRVGKAQDGSYSAIVQATDAVGLSQVSLPFAMDASPPVLRLLGRPPRIWVSEAATVTVRVNGAARRLVAPGPGPQPLAGIRAVRTLVAVARDAAGNRTILRTP